MWLSFLEQFPRKLKQNSRKINAKYSMLQRRSSSRKNYFNRLSFPSHFSPFCGHLLVSKQVTSIHKYMVSFFWDADNCISFQENQDSLQYDLFLCVFSTHSIALAALDSQVKTKVLLLVDCGLSS